MAEVSYRIARWEDELRRYKERTEFEMPEAWKVSLMLKMVPQEFERELRMRYVHGIKSHAAIRQNIMDFAQQVTGSPTGMDVNLVETQLYDDEGYALGPMGRRRPGQ